MLLTAFAWALLIIYPQPLRLLGNIESGIWFLDSAAILASSDAAQLGLDQTKPNPLDIYQRSHRYSSWWFLLGRAGLTREDNFLFGGAMVLGFYAVAFLLLVPRGRSEAVWHLALLMSPPVLFAVNRANNDLAVFAVLGLGLWAAGRLPSRGAAPFGLAVVLSTGLKFYPVLAAGAIATAPAKTYRRRVLAAILLLSGLILFQERDFLRMAVFHMPIGVYTFGAPVLWRALGVEVGWISPVSLLLLAAGAWWCVRRGWTCGLADPEVSFGDRLAFASGALLLIGCWLAGVSFGYRWIVALYLAPWLWRRAVARDHVARIGAGLLLLNLWADGLYCAVVNGLMAPRPEAVLLEIEHRWLYFSQPLQWIFLILLSGWLLELLCVRVREWRDGSQLPAAGGAVP